MTERQHYNLHKATEERIIDLSEAMDMIADACENALEGSEHEAHANAYILPQLRTWIDSGNRFDTGCRQYIEQLQNNNEDDDEDQAKETVHHQPS